MPPAFDLDQAVALQSSAAGQYTGASHPAWQNMVGPFGGITAATMMQAVMQHPELLGLPVSLTVNFCAGVAEGAFDIVARPVRTNRSTQHWSIELSQNGQVATTATAVTAVRRSTWSSDESPMPSVPPPEAVERRAFAPMPWVQRFDMRPITGDLPQVWDGRESDSLSRLWARDAQARPLDFVSLAAIADVFFPRVFLRRATRVPIGTVSMTVYFHAGQAELDAVGSSYLLGQARAQRFFNGFFDHGAQLWS
ncbi:MAG: thioesterase family protein, partial [Burkholderiaceae bacterium]